MSAEGKAVRQAKEKVEGNLDLATQKTEDLKGRVSNNISNIADKIHHGADSGKAFLDERVEKTNVLAHQALDKASQIGHQAADAISSSSEYIKNFDLENAKDSVKTAIKDKPEALVLAVGIIAFAVGYMVGKKNF